MDKEKHGLVISEKVATFDMLCKDDDTGEEFLVEVQNAPQNSFQDRVLSYSTYPIREQMSRRLSRIRDGEKLSRMNLGPEDGDKCNTLLEKFIFSLKHMHELDKCPDIFNEGLLKDLYRATELATMPIETREFYDHNMRTELDIIAQTDYAVRQGEARGKAQGKAERSIEIARTMLQNGLSVEKVMSCTGLSKEEVEALKH